MTVESLKKKTEGNPLSPKNSAVIDEMVCQWFDGTELRSGTFPLESLPVVGDIPAIISSISMTS